MDFAGIPIVEDRHVPRGCIIISDFMGRVTIHMYKPTPLYTRHMLGVIEAERDRRRRRRQLASPYPVGPLREPVNPERRR